MNDEETLLRARLAELLSQQDQDHKEFTQQKMADRLNEEGVASPSGKPWTVYSIRRIMKKLELSRFSETEEPGKGVSNHPTTSRPEQAAVERSLNQNSPLISGISQLSPRD